MPVPVRLLLAALAAIATLGACSDDGDGDDAARQSSTSSTASSSSTTTDDDTTSSTAEPGELCEVLPLEDVSALFGGADAEVVDGAVFDDSEGCEWAAEETAAGEVEPTSFFLRLDVYDGAEFYDPTLWSDDIREVEDLGDEAFVAPASDVGTTAGFREGDRVALLTLSISAGQVDSSASADDLVALLRAVEPQL